MFLSSPDSMDAPPSPRTPYPFPSATNLPSFLDETASTPDQRTTPANGTMDSNESEEHMVAAQEALSAAAIADHSARLSEESEDDDAGPRPTQPTSTPPVPRVVPPPFEALESPIQLARHGLSNLARNTTKPPTRRVFGQDDQGHLRPARKGFLANGDVDTIALSNHRPRINELIGETLTWTLDTLDSMFKLEAGLGLEFGQNDTSRRFELLNPLHQPGKPATGPFTFAPRYINNLTVGAFCLIKGALTSVLNDMEITGLEELPYEWRQMSSALRANFRKKRLLHGMHLLSARHGRSLMDDNINIDWSTMAPLSPKPSLLFTNNGFWMAASISTMDAEWAALLPVFADHPAATRAMLADTMSDVPDIIGAVRTVIMPIVAYGCSELSHSIHRLTGVTVPIPVATKPWASIELNFRSALLFGKLTIRPRIIRRPNCKRIHLPPLSDNVVATTMVNYRPTPI